MGCNRLRLLAEQLRRVGSAGAKSLLETATHGEASSATAVFIVMGLTSQLLRRGRTSREGQLIGRLAMTLSVRPAPVSPLAITPHSAVASRNHAGRIELLSQ